MHLRWRLAVVTGAGAGVGREVALRLARAGAGVLVVDPDLAAADAVAAECATHRVKAWTVQADLRADRAADDVRLLAARAKDLGGADLLVCRAEEADALLAWFAAGLTTRRGRRDAPGVAVVVGAWHDEAPDGVVVRAVDDDGEPTEVAVRVVTALADTA
ncbi:MAG: hypothetical protein CMH83_20400 [Nocardioides sp.]|nr:hypothetical protein [Nocardioides sp.]